MKLYYTRTMIHAELEGELNTVETTNDAIFGLDIPMHVPGVPDEVLIPKNTWLDKDAYDIEAKALAMKFHENFKKDRKSTRLNSSHVSISDAVVCLKN